MAKQIEKIFWHFRAFIFTPLLLLSEKDHAHKSNTRAEKERRGETVPFQKSRGYSTFSAFALGSSNTRRKHCAVWDDTHTYARA